LGNDLLSECLIRSAAREFTHFEI